MTQIPVILIFDIGKTNKKALLFNEDYEVVYEDQVQFDEIEDEDGFPCEDIETLTNWVKSRIVDLKNNKKFLIKAIHYTAYGASFVFIDEKGKVIAPLYNYLKPYKEPTKALFEAKYGQINEICIATASPDLGNLNSGLQLFRIKIEQPIKYASIKWALHLPQYLHYIITGELASDITSIGCHTMLWNFELNRYHDWVLQEGIDKILPPIKQNVGLHDSSAAIIPYLSLIKDPFVLISTGTWCISLNPFNKSPLSMDEMKSDTLFYLSYSGRSIKASRLFAGKEHELALKEITAMNYDKVQFDLAYEQLMNEIIIKQVRSTQLIIDATAIKSIFVDGGFSKNEYYLKGLANSFQAIDVFSAKVSQASSLGAALSMHSSWNRNPIPNKLIELRKYNIK